MKRCLQCGEPVTDRFVRVFGDRGGDVHACPACSSFSRLAKGAGAGHRGDRV